MNCERVERNDQTDAPLLLTVVSTGRKSRLRRKMRKSRALAAVEVFSLCVATGCVLWVAGLSAVGFIRDMMTPKPAPLIAKVNVASGDTLWSIARRLGVEGDQRGDAINKIIALNPQLNLNSNLFTGEVILVPITHTTGEDNLYLAAVSKSGSANVD